jgi:DNA repair ATPase RecN
MAMDNSSKKIEELKKNLAKDLDMIDDTADKETKALTIQMKSDIEARSEEFKKTFGQTATEIKSEIKSILDAAHELDKAYKEREAELPKLKEFLQLVDLVDDPSRVTDIRFLATIQLTLRKTAEWANLNRSKFGFYPSASDLSRSIEALDTMLSKVSFEQPPIAQ